MKFKGKAPEIIGESYESVYDSISDRFIADFRGNLFETEDEHVIERLKAMGYETVDTPAQTETFKCSKCDFIAKSAAGLSAHERSHKENQ